MMEDMEAAAVVDLTAILDELKRDISNAILKTDWQKDRDGQLYAYCDELLLTASSKSVNTITQSAINAGVASLNNWNTMLSLGGVAVSVNSVAMSSEQIKKWFLDTPLGGRTLQSWVEKSFSEGVAKSLATSLRKSAVKGEGYGPMVQDLLKKSLEQGVSLTKRDAITLARTYTQTANVEAQKAVYERNRDIVYAQKWVSVLDNRACIKCSALDGRIYKNGEPMPPLPLHPRCRCLATPCVRVDDMGITSEDLAKVARPWVIREPGNIDTGGKRKILNYGHTTENFDGWYKTLPKKEQIRVVGKVRQELLQNGQISFEELVNQSSGSLVTLEELGYSRSGERL